MRFIKLSVVLAGIAVFAFGCAGNSTNSNTANKVNSNGPAANSTPLVQQQSVIDPLASARKSFKESCARCHTDSGDGGSINIEGKTLKVPSFKRSSVMNDSDEDLADQIKDGSDEMPGFKSKYKDAEINDLVKFIRKELQGK
jgi:mono/diheme cytochrome c family protein